MNSLYLKRALFGRTFLRSLIHGKCAFEEQKVKRRIKMKQGELKYLGIQLRQGICKDIIHLKGELGRRRRWEFKINSPRN